jgi:uncharacterized membrane protein HdeD (DUF308 family)
MGTAPSATSYTTIASPVEELRRTRRWLMIAGALSLITGLVAIVLPNIASVATAILIGWVLVFLAAVYVVDAFSTRDRTRTVLRLIMAALTLTAGIYLLVAPLDGMFTLTVILSMWFVTIGIARLVISVSNQEMPGSLLLGISGALSFGLGLLIALHLPDSAQWAIGLLVGIDLCFTGAIMIALARSLR